MQQIQNCSEQVNMQRNENVGLTIVHAQKAGECAETEKGSEQQRYA